MYLHHFGGGDRRGIALHCSLAHGGVWRDLAAMLEEPLALVAPDLPGHGRSPDWDGQGDYITHCRDAVLALIGQDDPVDLIGHSGGAVIALQAALARPDMIRTLTLIEPVLFAAARDTPEWADWRAGEAPFEQALAAGDLDRAAALFTARWGSGRAWEETDAALRADIARRVPLVGASDAALHHDSGGVLDEGGLEALDLPVMLIIGGETIPVVGRIAERIAERLPDVGLAEVPGAGHMLTKTHAAQIAGLIDVNLSRD